MTPTRVDSGRTVHVAAGAATTLTRQTVIRGSHAALSIAPLGLQASADSLEHRRQDGPTPQGASRFEHEAAT